MSSARESKCINPRFVSPLEHSSFYSSDETSSGYYLQMVLSKLGATDVKSVINHKEEKDDTPCSILCGFNSDYPETLQFLAEMLLVDESYQHGTNYVISVSEATLQHQIEKNWKIFYNNAKESWEKKKISHSILVDAQTEYSDRIRLSEEGYQFLRNRSVDISDLSQYGLGLRHEPEEYKSISYEFMTPGFFPLSFYTTSTPAYHYIGIDNWSVFAGKTIPAAMINFINGKKSFHPYFMAHNKKLPVDLFHKITDFLCGEEKKSSVSPVLFIPVENAEPNQVEIEQYIKNIQDDFASAFPTFNKDVKRKKANFLSVVLAFHQANPRLSFVSCFQFARDSMQPVRPASPQNRL